MISMISIFFATFADFFASFAVRSSQPQRSQRSL